MYVECLLYMNCSCRVYRGSPSESVYLTPLQLEDQTTTKDPPASDCAGGGMKDTAESLAGLSLGDSLPPSTTEDATNPQSGPVRETLIDVLYSVPAGAKAEAESSKVPLGKEVYKYRRTAKVSQVTCKLHVVEVYSVHDMNTCLIVPIWQTQSFIIHFLSAGCLHHRQGSQPSLCWNTESF